MTMKVQLSPNGSFTRQQSPIKQLKKEQRQYEKQLRRERMNYSNQKPQINIEVIDPLKKQLYMFRDHIQYKKTFQPPRASHILKRYIIQQQRNLKYMRFDKIDLQSESPKKRPKMILNIENNSERNQKPTKNNQQINIPKIQQVFKNQHKQVLLYETGLMKNQISQAMNVIDKSVSRLKSYKFAGLSNANSAINSRRDSYYIASSFQINPEKPKESSFPQQYQIDKIIEKKLTMSKKLRDKLYSEKKRMETIQVAEDSPNKNMSYMVNIPKKEKRKILLKGAKSISYKKGQQQLKITPASSLLFNLSKSSYQHSKRQQQLEQLLQNSYQNRQTILSQKLDFYSEQTRLCNLSPKNQFKLRKLMDRKLVHTIEITKEQINKFVAYLYEIKTYHVIINETILNLLKEVRLFLLGGRVMKLSDLAKIVETKDTSKLTGYPNELILKNLSQMMI